VKKLTESALSLSVFCGAVALGQPAPCPCPPPPAVPPAWTGSAELSYLSTSGNTSTSSIGAGLEVDYKPAPSPWSVVFKAAYMRAATNDETTAEQFAAGLKGARTITERIDVFADASYLRNRFAGIDSLINGEAGAGYKLLAGPVHTLRPELAIGYTRKNQAVGDDLRYASGRAGLLYKWQFSKTADFTNEISYLYDFDDSSNWILTEKAAVTATLTSLLSLKASYTLLYSNEPVPTFKKTDTATAVALVAKF
jgi:putative salt-induced outer membrane protein